MKVEFFHTPGCDACGAAYADLRAAAEDAVKGVEWHELNVLDDLDRAVELGVITLPSIVVDGKLVFTSMPTTKQLREALVARTRAPK